MKWRMVGSLKRGAIDPPERCSVPVAHKLDLVREQEEHVEQAIWERDRPMSIEEVWRLQGRAEGYIKRKQYELGSDVLRRAV